MFIFVSLLNFTFAEAKRAFVEPIAINALYVGADLTRIELSQVITRVAPGSVVIVSEQHQFAAHHKKQLKFLLVLQQHSPIAGYQVSVGMEFLSYPYQAAVNQYLLGQMNEVDFLRAVFWQGNGFEFYRQQILFSRLSGGKTLALNAPRWLTAKISQQGLTSLSEQQRQLLPPHFEIGNEFYRERFWKAIGGDHVPHEKLINYFTAQSLWDDTMAWQTAEHLKIYPNDVVVIIVGDFHAIYGGGLKDRLQQRGVDSVISISQVNLSGLNEFERHEMLAPHPNWGARADFIWTSVNP